MAENQGLLHFRPAQVNVTIRQPCIFVGCNMLIQIKRQGRHVFKQSYFYGTEFDFSCSRSFYLGCRTRLNNAGYLQNVFLIESTKFFRKFSIKKYLRFAIAITEIQKPDFSPDTDRINPASESYFFSCLFLG